MLYGLDVWEAYSKRVAIDWGTVAKGLYKDFAICRASMASVGLDPSLAPNVIGARAAGIPLVGAYHVPSKYPKHTTAKGEVAHFQRLAKAVGGVDFAAIDLELPSTAELTADPTLRAAVARRLVELIEAFEDARGETPAVYGYASFFEVLAKGGAIDDAARCPFWLASYKFRERLYDPLSVSMPSAPSPWVASRPRPVIWQYAADGTGSVQGLDFTLPGVDRNVAPYDTVDQLREALGILAK